MRSFPGLASAFLRQVYVYRFGIGFSCRDPGQAMSPKEQDNIRMPVERVSIAQGLCSIQV